MTFGNFHDLCVVCGDATAFKKGNNKRSRSFPFGEAQECRDKVLDALNLKDPLCHKYKVIIKRSSQNMKHKKKLNYRENNELISIIFC